MERLPIEVVAWLLDYSPETGMFRWRKTRGRGSKAGEIAGCVMKNGYRIIGLDGKRLRAHHIAWALTHGEWPRELDHINGIRDDNRICNLRKATRAENLQNRNQLDKRNKSGMTGVSWDKDLSKWRAKICLNRKQIHLGVFAEKEEAAKAYRKAKVRLHTFNPVPRA